MSRSHFIPRARWAVFLGCLVANSLTSAQPFSRQSVNGEIREIPWNDMVDQVVTVDGVPWGWVSKGLGQYVASPSQHVYLNSLARKPEEIEGRLMRVTGVLRRHHMPAAPPGAQGYGQAFDYYSIDAFSIEPIEKVERDQMLPVAEDWIYVGMNGVQALDLMRARQLQEAYLAVENPRDGAEDFAYMVGERLAIKFDVLENKVVRMSTVNLHPEGKLFNEWTDIQGYPLPPRPDESGVPAKGFGKGLP